MNVKIILFVALLSLFCVGGYAKGSNQKYKTNHKSPAVTIINKTVQELNSDSIYESNTKEIGILLDGFYYIFSDDSTEAELIGVHRPYPTELIIPSKIEYQGVSYNVTTISSFAFVECDKLTKVTVSNGVLYIEESAFSYCKNLITIEIPYSVLRIGEDAFEQTAWYKSQPDGNIYIGAVFYKFKDSKAEEEQE